MSLLCVDPAALAPLLPMMMVVEADGTVTHVGPTLDKIAPGAVGADLGRVLRFVQPPLDPAGSEIRALSGRRLRVELVAEKARRAGDQPISLRCAAVPLPEGRMLLNLSFGADLGTALGRHDLSAQDFAETDPTVDLLFLKEAHAVVLGEFERMDRRLDAARAAAEEEAVTDKLTGLRNRRAMDQHLDRLVARRGAGFGLMHLDLDYFKSVNDTLGHAAGDCVLEQVARILRAEVRRGDMVARVGGDEFMAIFHECSDADRLERIAARIIQRLEEPIDWQGHVCRISGSIGITLSSFYETLDAIRLIADADAALYASKRAGRARHSVADPALILRAAAG